MVFLRLQERLLQALDLRTADRIPVHLTVLLSGSLLRLSRRHACLATLTIFLSVAQHRFAERARWWRSRRHRLAFDLAFSWSCFRENRLFGGDRRGHLRRSM